MKIKFKEAAQATEVPHLTPLVGANPLAVNYDDLCKVPCTWCKELVTRIKSRGGIVSMGPLP